MIVVEKWVCVFLFLQKRRSSFQKWKPCWVCIDEPSTSIEQERALAWKSCLTWFWHSSALYDFASLPSVFFFLTPSFSCQKWLRKIIETFHWLMSKTIHLQQQKFLMVTKPPATISIKKMFVSLSLFASLFTLTSLTLCLVFVQKKMAVDTWLLLGRTSGFPLGKRVDMAARHSLHKAWNQSDFFLCPLSNLNDTTTSPESRGLYSKATREMRYDNNASLSSIPWSNTQKIQSQFRRIGKENRINIHRECNHFLQFQMSRDLTALQKSKTYRAP